MQKYTKYLLVVFILLVFAKSALSLTIPGPSIWSDEYTYAKLAQGIFSEHAFLIHGKPISSYPPLYPALISPAYLLGDVFDAYQLMKIINSILSSLIIFPAYFLASEIMRRKKAFLCAVMVSILPMNFSFAPYVLSESIFYPLFLAAVYFIYKMHTDGSAKHAILAGIFTGLAILTKILGAALLVLPIAMFLHGAFRKANTATAKKSFAFYFPALLLVLPWMMYKGSHFGYALSGLFGTYPDTLTSASRHGLAAFLPSFLNWLALYAGYLVLASGVIFFIYAWPWQKVTNEKHRQLLVLAGLLAFGLVFLLANNAAGGPIFYQSPFKWFTERPIGRYMDTILPLVFILGFKGLEVQQSAKDKMPAKVCFALAALLAFSAQLSIAPLFPANNSSISYVGLLKAGLGAVFLGKGIEATQIFNWSVFFMLALLLAAIPILFLVLHRFRQITFKRVFLFFIFFFLLASLLNTAMTHYAAGKWQASRQMQLGAWLSNFGDETRTVLFDERDIGMLFRDGMAIFQKAKDGHFATIAGFWLKNKIEISDANAAQAGTYIISTQQLNKTLIKDFDGIYLYET